MTRGFCAALFVSLVSTHAVAVAPVSDAVGPDSELARSRWQVSAVVPIAATVPWQRFVSARGPAWQALWDRFGVPRRLWGNGVDAPGSVASPAVAEASARTFLEQHLDLLAPGGRVEDFEVVGNDLDADMRTVGMHQYRDGLRVVGGQLSFRFKNDRLFVVGSEVVPHVPAPTVTRRSLVTPFYAQQAGAWLRSAVGTAGAQSDVQGPFILATSELEGLVFRTVVSVRVDTAAPRGRWRVFVDAETAEPVRREQLLKFADGTVEYNVPDRWPGAGRVDTPVVTADMTVDGVATHTNSDGLLSWDGDAAAAVTANVTGSRVMVVNRDGAEAQANFSLDPGATYVWDQRDDERIDAQLNAYVAGTRAMEHARLIAPDVAWFRTHTLVASVNITEENCNAYSDGETINFYAAGGGCENTARLSDVVYHEFGHVFHAQVIIPGAGAFDTALSEGGADYFAASITGDPGTARGFFGDDDPLRHIDPAGQEAVWPRDVDFDPHVTGLIFAGAMWDLRKGLVAAGRSAGYADWLAYQALRRAADIPSSFIEILAADDDDGDLSNGTPNRCTIEAAFGDHGLVSLTRRAGVGVPHLEGLTARVPVKTTGTCGDVAARDARMWWRGRGGTDVSEVPMTFDDGGYFGELPIDTGRGVVEYRIEVELDNGDIILFPQNPASLWFEAWVGAVETIYCTDFESDPASDGWGHDLLEGRAGDGADDWQWGNPVGVPGSGDPDGALSGDRVIGNDLGGGEFNGTYQPGKTNAMTSPSIPVAAYDEVRLQYWRWLTVEDGRFDRASIRSNNIEVWSNESADGNLHHLDHQWRFHDVDLTSTVADGTIQVQFRLESDQGLQLGGWTIDDLCIVGVTHEVECEDCEMTARKGRDKGGCAGVPVSLLGSVLAGSLVWRRRKR